MPGVLATEDRVGLGHDLLDVAVAHARSHRYAAVFANDLGHRLRTDQVVEDRRAGILREHRLGATMAVVVDPLMG